MHSHCVALDRMPDADDAEVGLPRWCLVLSVEGNCQFAVGTSKTAALASLDTLQSITATEMLAFAQKLAQITQGELVALSERISVRLLPIKSGRPTELGILLVD